MIVIFLKRLLLITILSFSSWLSASQFDNPYQGYIVVESQSEADLKELALKQVLVKVSGNSKIDQRDETKLLVNQAQSLLSQYGYEKHNGTRYFSALFDQAKINQAIIDMQQPVWGDTRPTTLIWLVADNQLISDQAIKQSDDSALSWSIQNTQQQRGISLQFPLMDLDDNLALTVSDVKGQFFTQIGNASLRYEKVHFVAAELKNAGDNKWKLVWQLVQADPMSKQNKVLMSDNFVGSKSYVVASMINAIADYYAGQYAILDNQGEKFTQILHINGISSLAKLSKLNATLSNLLAISSFTIVSAQAQQVTVAVKIKGGLNSFKNAITVQPHLKFNRELTENLAAAALIGKDEPPIVKGEVPAKKAQALYFNWR